MWPRRVRNPTGEFPELEDDDDEQEWEVESIVDHKEDGRSKVHKYLIKWKSWPDDHNTWLYNSSHSLDSDPAIPPQALQKPRNTKAST